MNGEYIIDSYLDWLTSGDYVYDVFTKEWIYVGDEDESEV